jgi:hypothetical protein
MDRGPARGAREHHKIATALSALPMGVCFAFDSDFPITPHVADRQEIGHQSPRCKTVGILFVRSGAKPSGKAPASRMWCLWFPRVAGAFGESLLHGDDSPLAEKDAM